MKLKIGDLVEIISAPGTCAIVISMIAGGYKTYTIRSSTPHWKVGVEEFFGEWAIPHEKHLRKLA